MRRVRNERRSEREGGVSLPPQVCVLDVAVKPRERRRGVKREWT